MSGSKVNTYGIGDANIQALMLSTDKLFKGFHKVSLTNYDSTSESQIAAGSVIECAGALYKFDSNESMTGSPSDGTVYIRIVPGTNTCTAEYTNTAPTWSDAYQGWYGTGGAATYRYLEYYVYKSTTNYYKEKFDRDKKTYIRATLSASQTISSTSATTISLDTKSNDILNQFDTSTYTFTTKKTGNYLFNIKLRLGNITTESFDIIFYYNGSAEVIEQYSDVIATNDWIQVIITKQLSIGDTVLIRIKSSSDTSYLINYFGSLCDIIEL